MCYIAVNMFISKHYNPWTVLTFEWIINKVYICKTYAYLGICWIRSGIKQFEWKYFSQILCFVDHVLFYFILFYFCSKSSKNTQNWEQIWETYLYVTADKYTNYYWEFHFWLPVFLNNTKQCIIYNSAQWELIKFVNTFRLLGHFSQRKEQQKWSKNKCNKWYKWLNI